MEQFFHFSPRPNKAGKINWQSWSDDVFRQAQLQDKLILLNIGAVWCHWCHVMDETSFSHEPNIELVNERFIPVKVDNDKRPDLNRRYNMGGWPTTAVLLPDGHLLNGATYLSPDQLYLFLQDLDKYYRENKRELLAKAGELKRRRFRSITSGQRELDPETSQFILKELCTVYDRQYGGFGRQPKFPQADCISFLIYSFFKTKEPEIKEMIEKTLTKMSAGGVYDQELGGFFRYSTTRDWSIPHFEKMLEDNGKLLNVYLQAYQITNNHKYFTVVEDIVSYLENSLANQNECYFYGSQDADENYYRLSKEEREKVNPPYIDQTLYVDWNGTALESYLNIFAVTGIKNYLDFALKGIDFIQTNCFNPQKGMYHYYEGRGEHPDFLGDQLAWCSCLLTAYQVTGEKKYLNWTIKLTDLTIQRFYDREKGGFFSDLPDSSVLKELNLYNKNIAINGEAAMLLLKLNALIENKNYQQLAYEVLTLFNQQYRERSYFASSYGMAVDFYLSGPVLITIVGRENESATKELLRNSLKIYIPHKVISFLDPEQEGQIKMAGEQGEDSTAYICIGNQCYPPLFSGEEIRAFLTESIIN